MAPFTKALVEPYARTGRNIFLSFLWYTVKFLGVCKKETQKVVVVENCGVWGTNTFPLSLVLDLQPRHRLSHFSHCTVFLAARNRGHVNV